MINLFYSPHEKNYYIEKPGKCAGCSGTMEGWAVLVCQWNRKKSELLLFCKSCFNKIKTYSHITEYRVILISVPPYDSFPVIIRPPELCNSRNTSVFDIAKLESVKTTDRTIIAGRESIYGAKIGNIDYKRHDAGLNKNLTLIEFDKKISELI